VKSNISEMVYHKIIKPVLLVMTCKKTNHKTSFLRNKTSTNNFRKKILKNRISKLNRKSIITISQVTSLRTICKFDIIFVMKSILHCRNMHKFSLRN